MPKKRDIEIKFDDESRAYYIIWEPVFMGLGKTRTEALRDLREAVNFSADTLINLKLKDTGKGNGKSS